MKKIILIILAIIFIPYIIVSLFIRTDDVKFYYKEGMNVTAIFVDDDSIEEGKQIITGIIKPQINYKGVMIQAAQITVSQNI